MKTEAKGTEIFRLVHELKDLKQALKDRERDLRYEWRRHKAVFLEGVLFGRNVVNREIYKSDDTAEKAARAEAARLFPSSKIDSGL